MHGSMPSGDYPTGCVCFCDFLKFALSSENLGKVECM